MSMYTVKKILSIAILTFVVACGKSNGGGANTNPNGQTPWTPGTTSTGDFLELSVNRQAGYTFCRNGAFTVPAAVINGQAGGVRMEIAQAQKYFGDLKEDMAMAQQPIATYYRVSPYDKYPREQGRRSPLTLGQFGGSYQSGYDNGHLGHDDY